MREIDWNTELNAEQYAAVMHEDGPVLILAGAGSGKTRTMTYRVARLIEKGVSPECILLVTFTNKAAREMLARARELTGLSLDTMYAGTFHHLANRFLKDHYDLMGLPRNFTIWDEDKSRQELDIIIADLAGLKEGDPEKEDKVPRARAVMELLSYMANTDMSLDRAIDEKFLYLFKHRHFIADVAREYQVRMKRSDALDFDSLLLGWRALLRTDREVRYHYSKLFRHVLVDEFQDTNKIQMEILAMLSEYHKNLMVVGDDFQSIYSFRGADYDHILQFPDKYPDAKTYMLVTNYRSTPEIVELANSSIKCNEEQFEKTLTSGRKEGDLPLLANVDNQAAQADFVVAEIKKLLARGHQPEDIAVLYRAHFHAMEMQMELTRQRIPFKIVSGLGFFRQAHILDVIAYLSLVVNPRDEASLIRLLRKTKGVGTVTSGRICHILRETEDAYKGLTEFKNPPGVNATGQAGLARFKDIMAGMIKSVTRKEPLERLTQIILERGYQEHLTLTYDNAESRITDVREMGRFTNDYDDLGTFLSEVALTRDTEEAENTEHKVLLSTVHQAKGLEWKTVFVIGVAAELFPLGRVVREEGDKGTEEERRLFYVAVTRAKDNLYIVCPQGDFKRGMVLGTSRFIEELPEHVYRTRANNKGGRGIIPLEVPYDEKDAAKRRGARWDREGKFWYVPIGGDPHDFARWLGASTIRRLKQEGARRAA